MKHIRTGDWAYLVASFALSLWLVEAQRKDLNLSDLRISAYWSVVKVARQVRVAALRVERAFVAVVNEELERRV